VTEDANNGDLEAENKQLKQQLREYKAIQEDLMAQRVFEKTRKLFTVYITVGGLLLLLSGVVGVMQVVEYAKTHARETIERLVENESKKSLSDETDRQKTILSGLTDKMRNDLAALAKAKQNDLEKVSEESAARLRTIGQPLGATSTGQGGLSAASHLDYSSEMGGVRDEGPEGSTVAFAVADAMEYQIKKTLGKKVTISPRYIYYKARERMGTTDQDSGATIRDAVFVLRQTGAVSEDAWPYRPGEFRAKPPADVEKAEHYKIAQSQLVHNSTELKAALQRFGPVPGGVVLYGSATGDAVAKNGMIPMPAARESILGGHAVCFVGFDDGKKLLKFKNHWGQNWGDKGYGYLSYEYADRFLDDAWAISMESSGRP
jgi:C1A family cysteine protease